MRLLKRKYPAVIPSKEIAMVEYAKKNAKEETFFGKYIIACKGELLDSLDGQKYLGAAGEGISFWKEEYSELTDEHITSAIVNGEIECTIPTERGKAIYEFIRTFKRIPTDKELLNITEFMQTYGALE